MSMTDTPCLPAGTATDHGWAPTVPALPPHGAMEGLLLVVTMPTQPCSASILA
jgi:hypothetical protein